MEAHQTVCKLETKFQYGDLYEKMYFQGCSMLVFFSFSVYLFYLVFEKVKKIKLTLAICGLFCKMFSMFMSEIN